ncbi:MAG TPA: rhomboid family intramembrane serine protease [Ilumatobacteraceae bacterium]|nr:rhomboid family intramembrane serine protease [Ilumatobacteraceae bacterium]
MQAAVGSHCVDCVKASRPPVATRVRAVNARQHTLVTNVIIALNGLIFLWVALGDPSTLGNGGSISKRQFELGLDRLILQYGARYVETSRGPTILIDPDRAHEWYRLATSGFLHFGIIHLLLNMYLLYLLGQILERSLGRTRFILLYVASLLGGSAGVILMTEGSVTGGASGAVFGLMGAATIAMWRQGVNILQTGVGRTLVLNLIITFALGSSLNISIGGHLGGLVAGAACGAVMLAPKWRPIPRWATYATPVAVAVLAVVIAVGRVG